MTPESLTRDLNSLPAQPEQHRDPEIGENAAGGRAPIPEVVINRSSVAELERRRLQRLQTTALMILAVAGVLTLVYYAKVVLVILLISILLAFVLAPLVDFLLTRHVPRALGALVAVALLTGLLGFLTYVSYNRAFDFIHDLPNYKSEIQSLIGRFTRQAETITKSTETVLEENKEEKNVITVRQASSWTDMLGPYASAVTETVLIITFVPFLVYFMLSWQDHVRSASVMLFKMENRNTAYVMLGLIAAMIRSFIVGNLIIGLVLSAGSVVVFGLLHLPYFYFFGVMSGFLSLVPYLGVVLALVPPLIGGLGHTTTAEMALILLTVFALHLAAMNVLYPKILGKRLQLNPLAVTISLLFWGWLWGAIGLVLAVPIMGATKIVFDHIEPLRPYGTWLGE